MESREHSLDSRLRFIINEIECDHSTKLRLPELAAKVELSVRRVEQLFVEETSMTYVAFRRRLRMQLAEKLLSASQKHIKVVTFEVGYKATPFFCREFKKANGCTMTQFRAHCKKLKPALK